MWGWKSSVWSIAAIQMFINKNNFPHSSDQTSCMYDLQNLLHKDSQMYDFKWYFKDLPYPLNYTAKYVKKSNSNEMTIEQVKLLSKLIVLSIGGSWLQLNSGFRLILWLSQRKGFLATPLCVKYMNCWDPIIAILCNRSRTVSGCSIIDKVSPYCDRLSTICIIQQDVQ